MVAFCIIVGDTIPHVLGALFPSLRDFPEAMLHCRLERIRPTQFGVDHNQSNGPIHGDGLEDARPRSGMKMAFMNMANSIIGAGIIGQPYALNAHWATEIAMRPPFPKQCCIVAWNESAPLNLELIHGRILYYRWRYHPTRSRRFVSVS
jgi:hypothetical protein